MAIAVPTERTTATPVEGPPANETHDEKIARYGSPEFTLELTEAFHRGKRLGIQADRAAAESKNQSPNSQSQP